MMRVQLDDVRERGEPVAALFASEEVIYGRFGYGMASLFTEMRLPRTWAAISGPGRTGQVRLVEKSEALATFPESTTESASRRRGSCRAPATGGSFAGFATTPTTVLRCRAAELRAPRARRPQRRLRAVSPRRDRGVRRVEAPPAGRRGARAGPLSDAGDLAIPVRDRLGRRDPGLASSHRSPASAPGRAHRTPALEGGRRIVGATRRRRHRVVGARLRRGRPGDVRSHGRVLSLERRHVDASNGAARRSTRAPDLRLDVTALGGTYLGGFSFAQLARAGLVEESRRGGIARADALFATDRAPWCAEIF